LAPDPRVTRVDELIALFNRRSQDLPDGLFSRHTQFVLNDIPFEARLGRSPGDPLVLMLARGAAGYRFAAKAVQHAVPDAVLQRGEWSARDDAADAVLRGQAWLSGHLRGLGERAEVLLDVELRFAGDTVTRASVRLGESDLDRLRTARMAS
jgi:hypothetical protein